VVYVYERPQVPQQKIELSRTGPRLVVQRQVDSIRKDHRLEIVAKESAGFPVAVPQGFDDHDLIDCADWSARAEALNSDGSAQILVKSPLPSRPR
jgi:hypothetical protein